MPYWLRGLRDPGSIRQTFSCSWANGWIKVVADALIPCVEELLEFPAEHGRTVRDGIKQIPSCRWGGKVHGLARPNHPSDRCVVGRNRPFRGWKIQNRVSRPSLRDGCIDLPTNHKEITCGSPCGNSAARGEVVAEV